MQTSGYKSMEDQLSFQEIQWNKREKLRYDTEIRERENSGKYHHGKLIKTQNYGFYTYYPDKKITDGIIPIRPYSYRLQEIDDTIQRLCDEGFLGKPSDDSDSDSILEPVEIDENISKIFDAFDREDSIADEADISTDEPSSVSENNLVNDGDIEDCAGNILITGVDMSDAADWGYSAASLNEYRGKKYDFDIHCDLCKHETTSYGPLTDVSVKRMEVSSINAYQGASINSNENLEITDSQNDAIYLFNLLRGGIYAPHVDTYHNSEITWTDLAVFTNLAVGFVNYTGRRVYCHGIYQSAHPNSSNYIERTGVQFVPCGIDWSLMRFSDGQTYLVNITDGFVRYRCVRNSRSNYYIECKTKVGRQYYSYFEHKIVINGFIYIVLPFSLSKKLDKKLSICAISSLDVTLKENCVDYSKLSHNRKKRLGKSEFMEIIIKCARDGELDVDKLRRTYEQRNAHFDYPCMINSLCKMGFSYLEGKWIYCDVLYQKTLCPKIRSYLNPCMCVERIFSVQNENPMASDAVKNTLDYYMDQYKKNLKDLRKAKKEEIKES